MAPQQETAERDLERWCPDTTQGGLYVGIYESCIYNYILKVSKDPSFHFVKF